MLNQLKKLLLKTEEGKFKLNQRASIFLFCLLLSTFFWFLSVLGKNYTTTLKFYINYSDFSSDFILVETPIDYIEGEVFGSGYELLGEQLSLSREKIKLSLKNAKSTAIDNRYFIDTRQIRDQLRSVLDRDLQLNTIVQDSIIFLTQKRLSKNVQVMPDLELDFESGFDIRGEVSYSPKFITISGPKSYIDTVKLIKTERKVLKDLKDSIQLNLNILLPGQTNGIQASNEYLEVLVPVEKHTEKRLNLNVELSANYNYSIKTFPEQVTVVLLVPLSMYGQLTKSKMRAVAKIEDHEINNKLKVEVTGVPKYAKLIRTEPEKVEYIIRK